MMAAIMITPVLLSVGMAVDYSNMARQRATLQHSVDSAVLLASSQYFRTGVLPPVETIDGQVRANFSGEFKITHYAIVGDEVHISLKSEAKTIFMGFVGVASMDQEVDATAPVGVDKNIEIVLVLDTTGSMAVEGKMDALKSTAGSFVEDMLDAAPPSAPDSVLIGIVPYADYVNVGVGMRGQPWLDAPADEVTTSCHTYRPVVSRSGCTTTTERIEAQYVPEQCSGPTFRDGVQTSPGGCTPGFWRDAYTRETE